jgi:drug/metabolite transporter (DMT)-like permease
MSAPVENRTAPWALPTLALGAAAIGLSPIFVRLSEVGPIATGVNRMALALPFFYLMLLFTPQGRPDPGSRAGRGALIAIALSGVGFAGDLGFWHWSIKLTSVANATVLTNLAPVFVVIGARFLFGERVSSTFMGGMVLALGGVVILLGRSFELSAANFLGDLLGVTCSVFYGVYLLAVSRARRCASTASVMALGGTVSSILLFVVAAVAEGQVWPHTAHGWTIALLLAIAVQVGGQALIALSLAHVPAGFGSMVLLLQPVVAAAIAWAMFGEDLSVAQFAGAVAILGGVEIARRASRKRSG